MPDGCPTFAPAYSGFPVELAGVGELHAASLMKAAHAGVGGAPRRKSGYVGRKRRAKPINCFTIRLQRIPGAPHPRFPVDPVGFRKLHAPFLNERRTRGPLRCSVQEIRGISLVFGEMWDTTNLSRSSPYTAEASKSSMQPALTPAEPP